MSGSVGYRLFHSTMKPANGTYRLRTSRIYVQRRNAGTRHVQTELRSARITFHFPMLAEVKRCVIFQRSQVKRIVCVPDATKQQNEPKVCQTVSDRPERLIERIEPAANVISFVEQSGMQAPKMKAAHFFGPETFSNNEGRNMDYKQAAAIVKELDIPRTTVARLANMHATEVSAWLGGKLTFSQEKIERISQVVADIEKVVRTLPMRVDFRDPENVKRLIVAVNDAEAQLNLPLSEAPPLHFLDLRTTATAAD